MNQLRLCLSASIALALVMLAGPAQADDKEDGKKKSVHVVVAVGDDAKTIRIEGNSPEEVHRILAEKLKDLPADIRKHVEAALKQAKIQHGGSGDRRVIVRRIESKKSSQGKNPSLQIRVEAHAIHVGDGDAKTFRIEESSSEEVQRILVEKLKDLPADIRKHVESALKQAKSQHGGSEDRRVIIRRIEIKKPSEDKEASPKVWVEAHRIHVQPDGKTYRIELALPKLHLREGKDGEEAHKNYVIELDLDDDGSKSDARIKLHIVGDASAIAEHDGDKKTGRRIIILKADTGDAHGEHKHADHEQKKVGGRFVIGRADLHGLSKEVHAKIQAELKKHGLTKEVHSKIREALEKLDLPKEVHIKIREALEKHGHGDSAKSGQHGIIILDRKGQPGAINLKKGLHFEWLSDKGEAAIRKKLGSHAAELHKKAVIAIELATANHAEAKKVQESIHKKTGNVWVRSIRDVKQDSNIDKRLDHIEGELKAIRKLLEKLSKRG